MIHAGHTRCGIVEKIDRRYAIAIVEDVGRGNGRSHEFRDHRGHVPFTTCRFPVRRRSWVPMGVVEAQVLKTARALSSPWSIAFRISDRGKVRPCRDECRRAIREPVRQ